MAAHPSQGYVQRRVMNMIDRTLKLTWRKALAMVAVWAGLLALHFAVDAAFHVDEPILFLGAALAVPMWALSAAVYTFDNLMLPRGHGWRHSSLGR